jgi:hypothetical protein
MTAVALLDELHRRGVQVELSADGRVHIRPRAAVRDLEALLRARARELKFELQRNPGQKGQNTEIDRARPSIVPFVPGFAESQNHVSALDPVAGPVGSSAPDSGIEPPVWLLGGSTGGEMRLAVQGEPPWPEPELVNVAVKLVERIDDLHRAGRDREAEGVAMSLEKLIEELRREGVTAWLTS